jgi:transposase
MRGTEDHQPTMFSYVSQEDRIPEDHPLRALRKMVDPILDKLSNQFEKLYADRGRPSIPPEQLLRALLIQILYTIRSERRSAFGGGHCSKVLGTSGCAGPCIPDERVTVLLRG